MQVGPAAAFCGCGTSPGASGEPGELMKKLGGVLAAWTLLAVPPAALASSTPMVANSEASSSSGGLVRRPALIVYSGDGAAFLGGAGVSVRHPGQLHWTTWGPGQARACGADWQNNYVPDCVDGTYSPYRANAHLCRPRIVVDYSRFTRMTATHTGEHPPYPAYGSSSWTMLLESSAQHDTYFWFNS